MKSSMIIKSKQEMGKAIKSFAKMVNAKVSKEKEKAKRHTDIKGMFKPISKKVKVRLVSPQPLKRPLPIKKEIDEIGVLDSVEKIDKAIDLFIFPTIKYDRDADYYAQKQIKVAELLKYYHKKMNGYFGYEHPIPKKKEERVETKTKPKDKRTYTRQPQKQATSTQNNEPKTIKVQQEKSVPAFNAIATKTWILDWECVTFKEGYFTVWSPSSSNYHFKPLNVQAKESTGALNYLRTYLKKKLPPIYCTIVGKHNKLVINDPVRLNEAIQVFAKEARQRAAKVKRNSNIKPQPSKMSFSQAMSKARQMSASDFRKYKSKFIDFLVDLQDEHYKVIPCVERLAHSDSDTMEFAFMFTMKCRSGRLLIVHENINPDRSTLLFTIWEDNYMKNVQSLYDFLQSAEINKRSALRNADFELDELGVGWYGSINHDEFDNWSWKIKYYRNSK